MPGSSGQGAIIHLSIPGWRRRVDQKWHLLKDVPGRKLGSMVRINGLFHLLTNGVYIEVTGFAIIT